MAETQIINIENGMFQYFIIFSFPNKIKIHTYLLGSTRCPQNRTQQNQLNNHKRAQKAVKFIEIPNIKTLYVWQFAHAQARKDIWQQVGRDRERFKTKIDKFNKIISPILQKKYEKILKNSKNYIK